MTGSRFLNSKEVGSIYLHEDSVPNMAGSRGCFKKIRRKGKKGRRKRRVGAGEMSLCTAGVTRTDNAVQAVSSCQILLLQASVLSRVTAKQGLLQHQKPKPKSCFWKSNRERQATWLCRDAMRQVWQQLPQRILQPQPCRSSKTIAGLMQTQLTSEPCTDGLPASHRLRAWGKQRAKGNAFVTKTQEIKSHVYSPLLTGLHPVIHQALKRDLNEI